MKNAGTTSAGTVNLALLAGKRRRTIKRAIFIAAMLTLPVIHFLIFYVYINFSSIFIAFKRYNYSLNREVWCGLANFERVFEELSFQGKLGTLYYAIRNSIIYFLFNELLLMPLTVFFAFFFFSKMPGHKVYRLAFLLPSIIPGVVLPMLYSFMLDSSFGIVNPLLVKMGLASWIPVNGWFGEGTIAQVMILVYMLWSGCGTNIILMCGNMNRLPQEVFESARLDGITLFKELWYIVLPMLMPVFSIMVVTGTALIFNIYLPPMLLTNGGPMGETMTIAFIIMNWTTGGEEYLASAAGLLFSLVGIPLVLALKFVMEKFTPEVEW